MGRDRKRAVMRQWPHSRVRHGHPFPGGENGRASPLWDFAILETRDGQISQDNRPIVLVLALWLFCLVRWMDAGALNNTD